MYKLLTFYPLIIIHSIWKVYFSGNQGLKGEPGNCPDHCVVTEERILRLENALEGNNQVTSYCRLFMRWPAYSEEKLCIGHYTKVQKVTEISSTKLTAEETRF